MGKHLDMKREREREKKRIRVTIDTMGDEEEERKSQ